MAKAVLMAKSINQRKIAVKNMKHEERLKYYFINVIKVVIHREKKNNKNRNGFFFITVIQTCFPVLTLRNFIHLDFFPN